MAGRVVHFEIPYDDGERAKRFYGELFGWDLSDFGDQGYVMVATGPLGEQGPTEPGYIGGGLARREGPNQAPTVVIDVEDIDVMLDKVVAAGGSIEMRRSPVGDMGYAAYFKDPEGNMVGLWQSA